MPKKHKPIHNLGAFAHKPKAAHGVTTKPVAVSNVNYSGPRKSQTRVETPKVITTRAKGKRH